MEGPNSWLVHARQLFYHWVTLCHIEGLCLRNNLHHSERALSACHCHCSSVVFTAADVAVGKELQQPGCWRLSPEFSTVRMDQKVQMMTTQLENCKSSSLTLQLCSQGGLRAHTCTLTHKQIIERVQGQNTGVLITAIPIFSWPAQGFSLVCSIL